MPINGQKTVAEIYDEQVIPRQTDPLLVALRALNNAAYAAIRAGRDTTQYPDLDRQKLREIARDTDKLFDDNAGRR